MHKISAFALMMLALPGQASAVVYTGYFNGFVTSGVRTTGALWNCDCDNREDLSGRAMTLSFRTEILDIVDPADFPDDYPGHRSVITDASVAIAGGITLWSGGSNYQLYYPSQQASYRGNEKTGLSSTFYMPNNYYYTINYHFGLADDEHRFFGFGSAIADEAGWSGNIEVYTAADFRLTSGSVVVTGTPVRAVPEPQTWALMTFGIGLVGAAARRRPRARSMANV